MFSSYKSLQKKKEGGQPTGRASRAASTGSSNPAELARQVKALVEAHGAAAVKQMADVFAE